MRLATSIQAQQAKLKQQYEVLQGLQEDVATARVTRQVNSLNLIACHAIYQVLSELLPLNFT